MFCYVDLVTNSIDRGQPKISLALIIELKFEPTKLLIINHHDIEPKLMYLLFIIKIDNSCYTLRFVYYFFMHRIYKSKN